MAGCALELLRWRLLLLCLRLVLRGGVVHCCCLLWHTMRGPIRKSVPTWRTTREVVGAQVHRF